MHRARPYLTLAAALFQPFAPLLAFPGDEGAGDALGGEAIRTLITPAGYAFSIWGVIFAWSLAFGVWQVLPAQRENELLRRLGVWPALVFGGSALWLFVAAPDRIWLTVVVIVGMLLALVAIWVVLEGHGAPLSASEGRWVRALFGLYAGWITVATCANVAAALNADGFTGAPLAAEGWAVIVLALAGVAASVFTWRSRSRFYAGAVSWAVAAIAVANARRGETLVVAAAVVVIVAVIAVVVAARRRDQPS